MPFKKGVATPGSGRKGYAYEQEQMEEMKSVLNRTIKKCDKILEGKADDKDIKALEAVKQVAMKIMDKLHANKAEVDITSKGEQIYSWSNYAGDNNNIQPKVLDQAIPRVNEEVESNRFAQEERKDNSNDKPLD
jgi:hypothetical protein